MEKFKVIFPPLFKVPDGHSFKTALIKGARAYQKGEPIESNPYKDSRGGFGAGYQAQWVRGWNAMKAGVIRIESCV